MKILFLSCVACLLIGSSYGQSPGGKSKMPNTHEIGVGAGHASGIGLSFRGWRGPMGYQLTLTPIFDRHSNYMSLGVTGMKSIKEAEKYRYYLYLGGHVFINDDLATNPYGYYARDRHYILGGGGAVDIRPGQGRFGINLMVGYGADIYSFRDGMSYEDYYSNNYKGQRIGIQGGAFVFYRL